ncbi:hypothetical protein [Chitinophaga solisilvae]|uniref:hypothetical protein n=1 Tax=Chitinophaga solisilvae TaxID=1233460 RepID=UPI001F2ABFA8|nr:hypothetical protein [Chitinophaga solisilvae]
MIIITPVIRRLPVKYKGEKAAAHQQRCGFTCFAIQREARLTKLTTFTGYS